MDNREANLLAIQIWTWENAPDEYRELSNNGGDEEGVVFIPHGVDQPWWLESMWSDYGAPQRTETMFGTVIIWAHA